MRGMSTFRAEGVGRLVVALAALPFIGCSGDAHVTESLGEQRDAVTQAIVISGHVYEASGRGRAGVTVTLAGNVSKFVITDQSGYYEFPGLAPGSYSVRPTASGCAFAPDVVNLNNLASTIVQDFAGSGSSCGGESKLNSGAASGTYALSGRVLDGSGRAVVGARIRLGGNAQAVRFTDFAGGYSFRVNAGSYSLQADAACALAPQSVNLNNVASNKSQTFTTSGAGCIVAQSNNAVATGRVLVLSKNGAVVGRTYVHTIGLPSAAGAAQRLAQIGLEQIGTESISIAGRPAIQRIVALRGAELVLEEDFAAPQQVVAVTTAIQDSNKVIRFESRLAENAAADLVGSVIATGRNFEIADLQYLTSTAPVAKPMQAFTPPATGQLPVALAPSGVAQVDGEVSVAASDVSSAMVLATSNGPFFSANAGSTVARSVWTKTATTGGVAFASTGDPEVAVGAPDSAGKQNFYMSMLSRVTAGNPPTVALALFQSTDDGKNFGAASNAYPVDCSLPGSLCIVPDQEMLAADRKNRAVGAGGATFDQLYLSWRDASLTATGSVSIIPAVACSADGGTTWTVDRSTLASSGGDYVRLEVAPDGSLLAAYGVFTGQTYSLMMQKFSSCAGGLAPVGAPVLIAKVTNPAAMAGMPRQPVANYSVTGAADDATGQVLFAAYANETTPGNEDVVVARSMDGGSTWPTTKVMNTVGSGHRYFPSICSTGNSAFVSWYDRRAGAVSGASNDLTAYYRSSIATSGATVGAEFNVSTNGSEDPQCLTGFPGGSGSSTTAAETQCTNLPNVLFGNGQCQGACAAGATAPCGSLAACDFRAGAPSPCPVAENCSIPAGAVSRGSPKYGDYAISACAQGRVFMAWASGTAPGGGCRPNGTTCSVPGDCCTGSCTGGACAPSAAACSANGAACAANGGCCSGTCQGGQCFAPVQLYTQSTSCVGAVPSDLTCQTSQPPADPVLKVSLSGTDSSQVASFPWKICGTGSGFTPGSQVGINYVHPRMDPATKIVATADASGNAKFTAEHGRVALCTLQEFQTDIRTFFSDQASGRTLEVTFSQIPTCFLCSHVQLADGSVATPSCGTDFNGGCN